MYFEKEKSESESKRAFGVILQNLMGEEREWESGMCEFKLWVDPQILGFVTKLPYSTNGLNLKCKERERDPMGYGSIIIWYMYKPFLYLYVREKFKSLLNIPIVTKH